MATMIIGVMGTFDNAMVFTVLIPATTCLDLVWSIPLKQLNSARPQAGSPKNLTNNT